MSFHGTINPPPCTQAVWSALQSAKDTTSVADLLFLEAWESRKPMHLGVMLRIRQIRRANPRLSAEIAAELTVRRNTDRTKEVVDTPADFTLFVV